MTYWFLQLVIVITLYRNTVIHIYNRVSRVQIAFKCTCKMSLINSNRDGEVILN
jgi:glycerol-3-phosphate O-acyltransferase